MSGIGNAYFGMGLANAVNQIPVEMRAAEDRRRAQAKDDELMQMRRDEIASNLKQRGFENDLQTRGAARADAAAGDTHSMSQHAIGRFGTEDAQHDQQFAMLQQLNKGKVDMLPLERKELLARIGAAGDATQLSALHRQLLGLNIQNEQMNYSKAHAVQDLDSAHIQAQSANDPQAYADWFNNHTPAGQRVEIKPNAKGGYDALHYAVGSSADGPPGIQLVNTKHFGSLDDIGEEAQNLVHSDDLYKAQIHGLTNPNWVQARGENGQPVRFNKRNGQYYNNDGSPFTGKLAPTSGDIEAGMMGYGMGNAQPGNVAPHPGSQFIGGALQPQQRVQQQAPNTGFNLGDYVGDGTNGYQ